eukprot:m.83771 g.83771  ORF g.83771 m.83771 type:complete len:535 (+) comp9560_c0_seq1:111-1715(+)
MVDHNPIDIVLAKILKVDLDDPVVRTESVPVLEDERSGPDTNIKREMQQLVDIGTRFKHALNPYINAFDYVEDIVLWKNPKFTALLFAYYVLCCIYGDVFAGFLLLAIISIAITKPGEGIFTPKGTNGTSGNGNAGAAAASSGNNGAPIVQSVDQYPSTAAPGSAPPASSGPPGPAAPTQQTNNSRRQALVAGISNFVSKGVSKMADGLQGLSEARAAGRKMRQLLHPWTITLEKISGLLNYRVPYNTYMVLFLLCAMLVTVRLLPWWQVDILFKLAFGYIMFVRGAIRKWLRGEHRRRGAIDVFWDSLPTKHSPAPAEPATSSPSVARHQPNNTHTAGVASARPSASSAPPSPRVNPTTRTSATSTHTTANSGTGGSSTPPARPPPPAMDAVVSSSATPPPQPQATAATPQSEPNPLVAQVVGEKSLGSWSVIHVNSQKKGTLLVGSEHVAILLPNASSPASVAVAYQDVLSVSKKGGAMMQFALMIVVRDRATDQSVTHKLTLKGRDEAHRLLCDRLGFPVGDDVEPKDKAV